MTDVKAKVTRRPLVGKTVGERILEAIENAGYNKHSFALTTNIGYPTIHNWVSGKSSPRLDSLKVICETTGYHYDEIMGPMSVILDPEAEAALQAFLMTGNGKTASLDEIERMRSVRFREPPTPAAYGYLLTGFRSTLSDEDAVKAAEYTASIPEIANENVDETESAPSVNRGSKKRNLH